MSTLIQKTALSVRTYVRAHKVIATIAALIVLFSGYRVYTTITAPSTANRYVTTTVATGTVVATLTESGQVNASQSLTLSPKASGQVIGVYVRPGDHVYAGQVIAQLDATDAETALTNAKLALAHEQLSYEQATATSTLALNLLQAKNAVINAQTALNKTHDTSYAAIASIYTDLSNAINTVDAALYDADVPGRANQQNIDAYADMASAHDNSINIFKNTANTSYAAAVAAYTTALATYKATPSSATNDTLAALADTTYTAARAVAQAVRDAHDFFDRVNTDYTLYNIGSSAALTSSLTALTSTTATVTNDLSNVLTIKTNIISAEQTLAEAQNALQTTEGGTNALTVQAAQISLRQAEQAVASAEETLAGYTVTAPFSGTIASVSAQRYDQVSSGTNIATLVTDHETADVSVNEVDASKIRVGQKVMLTFDALPTVSIAGTVASLDRVGNVSQGVVSYNITIGFATTNPSVLPGMSVTADIITGTATGLVIPTSALKTAGSRQYVEVFNPPLSGSTNPSGTPSAVQPSPVTVTTGLSDDTHTIIISGITAGEQVVTRTIAGSADTSTVAPSLLNAGSRAGARGAFRAMGG